MPQPIVECIANFSEGRRPEVVAQIEKAILAIPQVHVLDKHSDHDHNRTVITFAGPPKAIKRAAFAAIASAAELIDMTEHHGEHPRIGATDVVPFVPIQGVSMDDCVALAEALGEQVAEELMIPVYLYEKAARTPQRVNLEDIRRGEYELLKQEIAESTERAPDFGPKQLGSAGAVVIGARAPLVAYNVYLTTAEVAIAKRIAKAIRHSSGGLRYVKSIGLEVDGRAQVSMNLTDYRKTPLARVTELIRREAKRYGVTIHHAELVGLAPQDAFIEAARWYLQLDQFEPDQLLETRLYEAMEGERAEPAFLDQLAAGTATPGGGSAAAQTAATGAALTAMVGRLTIGKKKYKEVEPAMQALVEESEGLRQELTEAMAADAAAFEAVMQAYRLPKDSDSEAQRRSQAIEAAIHRAAEVPLMVAEKAVRVAQLGLQAANTGNSNAITDAAAAANLALAAMRSAALNVRINAQSAADEAAVSDWLEVLQKCEAEAARIEGELAAILKERADLPMN